MTNYKKRLDKGLGYRNIETNDFAILITADSNILYKRIKDIWIKQNSNEVLNNRDLCNNDALGYENVTADDLIAKYRVTENVNSQILYK